MQDWDERKKLQRERLWHAEHLAEKRHQDGLDRIKRAHQLRQEAQMIKEQKELDKVQLQHNLTPEMMEWNYENAIKMADLELQSLDAELSIRNKHAHVEYERRINEAVELTIAEIVSWFAEHIFMSRQETERREGEHRNAVEMRILEQRHEAEMAKLKSELENEGVRQQEMARRILIPMVARELGIFEGGEINKDDLTRMMAELFGAKPTG